MPRSPEVCLIVLCPHHSILQIIQLIAFVSTLETQSPTPWWWLELWYEQRKLFKELIKHVVVFIVLFGTLESFHWVIGKSRLEPARLFMLDKFHFWSSIVLLFIFAVSLIIKVLL